MIRFDIAPIPQEPPVPGTLWLVVAIVAVIAVVAVILIRRAKQHKPNAPADKQSD